MGREVYLVPAYFSSKQFGPHHADKGFTSDKQVSISVENPLVIETRCLVFLQGVCIFS